MSAEEVEPTPQPGDPEPQTEGGEEEEDEQPDDSGDETTEAE